MDLLRNTAVEGSENSDDEHARLETLGYDLAKIKVDLSGSERCTTSVTRSATLRTWLRAAPAARSGLRPR